MMRVIDGPIYHPGAAEPVHRWDNGRLDDDLFGARLEDA